MKAEERKTPPRLSLRKLVLFLSIVLFIFIGFIGVEEYYQNTKALRNDVEKILILKTIQLKEYFQSRFERVNFVFRRTENLDLVRLLKARDYFDRMEREILPLYRELNKEAVFGSYDIYLIDRNRTIRRSSLSKDVGLDFRTLPVAMKIFDMVETQAVPYYISRPMYMPPTQDFRRYLLIASKNGKFFIQISHNYFPIRKFAEEIRGIKENDPNIRELELCLSANGVIRSFEIRYRKKSDYFERFEESKKKFLAQMTKDLEMKAEAALFAKDPGAIRKLFEKKKIRYRIDPEKKQAIIYTTADYIFNDSQNQETIILRMVYDLSEIFVHYQQEYRRVAYIIVLSLLIALLVIFFIKSLFVKRLESIVSALKEDEKIRLGSPDILEFAQLAEAIEAYREKLKRRNHELEILTFIDPLTGAYNRRYFVKKLDEFIYEYTRYGKKFALMIFDIDNFKQVNDRYGHDTGDRVLREISARVKNSIRKNDLFFRIGGEEFAILVSPIENISDAEKKAEFLRKAIGGKSFSPGFTVTISIGVSIFEDEDDSISLFKRVDRYLYRSKARGKNTVTSSPEE